jgi:peptidoglycan hydrolase-like protein with peptidoglycan-binding domain
METLAYLHHACSNEAPDELPSVSLSGLFGGFKFSGTAYIKITSVLVSLVILTSAHVAMAALQRGDRGANVSNLQNRLTAVGCYNGPITGFFGSVTQAAVIQCQRRLGLTADGIVGPRTLAALLSGDYGVGGPIDDATYGAGVLRRGSQGSAVVALQSRLREFGFYRGASDGIFGPGTEAAVIQFQRSRGLFADGVAGTQVLQALNSSVPSQPSYPVAGLSRDSSGAAVEALQRRLRDLGYFNATVTGYYGSVTQDAVTRFQQTNGLQPTGVADGQTLSVLGVNYSSNGYSTGGGNQPNQSRYLVIVPKQDQDTLGKVRRYVPNAFQSQSRLGEFIQVGAHSTLESANTQSELLRARGLDARVSFQ